MGWTYTLGELAAAVGASAPAQEIAFSAVSTDTRTLERGAVFFALRGQRFDGAAFVSEAFQRGACAAVTREPNSAGPCLTVDDTLEALQRFAAWHRARYRLPVIAITGSCGKTSTKDLVAAVLASRFSVAKTPGNLNNEIGCPLSLLQIDHATERAVIEMGANHLGEIARLCALARPTESVITMVAPAHLEGFGNIENVARAKGEILEALPADGTFYLNTDDAWCCRLAESFPGEKVRFGQKGDVRVESCAWDGSGEMELRIAPAGALRLPLLCRAHALNVLIAVAVGLHHGIEEFEGPLRKAYEGTARIRVLRLGDLEILDDTYNANPASMAVALETLAERPGGARIAAVGDMLELGKAAGQLHRELGALTGRLQIDCVFALGEFATELVDAARASGVRHAEAVKDHATLAQAIADAARPGDLVLVKGSRAMQMERVIDLLRNVQD